MHYYGYIIVSLLNWWKYVEGHGRLIEPPSRSSMWRYGFNNPPNYNDNQLYCGGVQVQYEMNGGKCGVCGDPWPGPRDNEEGGKYSNGIIVRTYEPGEVIDVTVELTASHKGYFEFKLCPKDDPMEKTTQQCLDNYILQLEDGSGTRYRVPSKTGYQRLTAKLKLPENVKCRDCTFQWRYNAGNSWGSDSSGRGCVGCGNQEQFYGCSDIAIGYDDIEEGESLITGENHKKENYVPPPPPVTPRTDLEDTSWDQGHPTTNFWDSLVSRPSEHGQNNEVSMIEEFQKFQTVFKNKQVRPCVCHSCIGNTCVCECIPISRGQSFLHDGINSWLMYISSIISCLIPLLFI